MKKRVQKHFSLSASKYDEYAVIPKKLSSLLIEFIDKKISVCDKGLIFDVGAGTGDLAFELSKKFSNHTIVGCDIAIGMLKEASKKYNNIFWIHADAEKIPLKNSSCDLVVSNATYQWIFDLDKTFNETYRILKSDGKLVFTTFGEGTLRELIISGSKNVPHLEFISKKEIVRLLEKNNFFVKDFISQTYVLYYPSLFAVLRSLKNMGAGNIFWSRELGLAGKVFLKKIEDDYIKSFKTQDALPVTFETFLVSAEKK